MPRSCRMPCYGPLRPEKPPSHRAGRKHDRRQSKLSGAQFPPGCSECCPHVRGRHAGTRDSSLRRRVVRTFCPEHTENRPPGEEAGRLRRREKRRTRLRSSSRLFGSAPAPARGRDAVRPARTGENYSAANFSRWTLRASACSSQLANPACCRASNTVASQSQEA